MASIPMLLWALLSIPQEVPAAQASPLSFGGPLVVKVEGDPESLRAGDFDGDGRGDLAVVNNSRARVELLLSRDPKALAELPVSELNVPADDPHFERRLLLTERKIGGFVSADFDADGKRDLAWYGDPAALVVAYQRDAGAFAERRELPIPDGSLSPNALAAEDIDGDGRADLVLLGKDDLVLVRNGERGLGEPERSPSVLERATVVLVGDVDGSGRKDLVFVDNNDESPLRVRFQREDGGLGPEIAFRMAPLRAGELFTGDAGHGMLAIPRASGTLRHLRFRTEDAAEKGLVLGSPRRSAHGAKAGEQPRVRTGDLDGDGLRDVVLVDPEAASLLVWRGTKGGELNGPERFPTFKAVVGLEVSDLDQDGKAEVVVLSREEKSIGIQRFEGRRLGFPRPLPTGAPPTTFAVADLDRDGLSEVIVATRERSDSKLRLFPGGGQPGREPLVLDLAAVQDANETVDGVVVLDLDGDGRKELLVLCSFGVPRVFRGGADGSFTEIPAKTLYERISLQGLTKAGTGIGDLDGDGADDLLVIKDSFVRAARLDPSGTFTLLDQVNAPAGATVVAAALAELDGEPGSEVVLLDGPGHSVRVLGKTPSGTFEERRRVDLGEESKSLLVDDVTGDGRVDLLVAGPRSLTVIPSGRAPLVVDEGPAYASVSNDATLSRLAVGDFALEFPGPEVVVVDTANASLEILGRANGAWKRLAAWRVFEEKTFEQGGPRRSRSEPSEIVVADVTGDGKLDLALLCHDRVLVYPRL